jgi:hypothetical protein
MVYGSRAYVSIYCVLGVMLSGHRAAACNVHETGICKDTALTHSAQNAVHPSHTQTQPPPPPPPRQGVLCHALATRPCAVKNHGFSSSRPRTHLCRPALVQKQLLHAAPCGRAEQGSAPGEPHQPAALNLQECRPCRARLALRCLAVACCCSQSRWGLLLRMAQPARTTTNVPESCHICVTGIANLGRVLQVS